MAIIGYIPTALHAINGNKDHANRGLAKATNATITATSGLAGFTIGGVAGGGAGGAVGAVVGSVCEKAISTKIKDPNIKSECDQFTSKEAGYNILFGAIGGATSGTISNYGKSIGASKKVIKATRLVNGVVIGMNKKMFKNMAKKKAMKMEKRRKLSLMSQELETAIL
eukprot:CAMPEP_0201564860 /NCGR_PEP_ID=MMETSP0190_2-20130828/3498_1 /ASSEMBLY_ACC=CAM_ASM_000263 /TAXON_ID=37353 /ORGANISM="Rosalina sp." /LENGTH=167 /DNA_ID=CAMNT_0047981607 /DNA_START=189 /DNA_END=692 /DNA_ORIENTATION=+